MPKRPGTAMAKSIIYGEVPPNTLAALLFNELGRPLQRMSSTSAKQLSNTARGRQPDAVARTTITAYIGKSRRTSLSSNVAIGLFPVSRVAKEARDEFDKPRMRNLLL